MINIIRENELKSDIAGGCKFSVYLLFGDDSYLVKKYADSIAAKVVGENADLDLVKLDYTASSAQIAESMSQFSFAGGRKCVTVSNLDFEGMSAAELKDFKNMLKTLPDGNVLVLYYDAVSINPKKSERFKSIDKLLSSVNGVTANLEHKTELQLVKMLTDGAQKRGCKMNDRTAKFLISYCSDELNILINELNKLSFYVKNGEITEEHIEKLCSPTLEASIYNISRYIISRNVSKAIEEVNVLLSQKVSAVFIANEICSCFIDIYCAKAAGDAGMNMDAAAKELSYPRNLAFRMSAAERNGRSISDKKLSCILNLLFEADAEIKTGNGSLPLEKLIVNIARVLAEKQK